jgi:hypothetical protein
MEQVWWYIQKSQNICLPHLMVPLLRELDDYRMEDSRSVAQNVEYTHSFFLVIRELLNHYFIFPSSLFKFCFKTGSLEVVNPLVQQNISDFDILLLVSEAFLCYFTHKNIPVQNPLRQVILLLKLKLLYCN